MNVTQAAFRLVRDFPGGAVALAPFLGKSAATLSHEVNPAMPTYKLGIQTAVDMTIASRNPAILNAFAAECGFMVLPLPSVEAGDDVVNRIAGLAKEFAEEVQAVSDALADGEVTANEVKRIEREGADVIAAVQSLLVAVRDRYTAGLPKDEAVKVVAVARAA